MAGTRFPIVRWFFVHPRKLLFFSVYVYDKKSEEQTQAHVGQVDREEPTPLLDQVHLGCMQRECKPNLTMVQENKDLAGRDLADTDAVSYDMAGHAKKCVERYCELAKKKIEQLYKISSQCLDDHQFKTEDLETVGDLSTVRSHILLKCSC